MEPKRPRARVPGAEALAHQAGPDPAGGPELRHLLQEVVVRVEEERQLGRERVDLEPRGLRRLHVSDRVGQREGDLLHGRRARLAQVVARDRDRVPAGHAVLAVAEDVGHQPERRPGREDVRAARDELLQDVVLHGAGERRRGDPPALGHRQVEGEQDGGGRVDRHRGRDPVEGQVLEELGHVVDARDRHADPADLAARLGGVRVVAHLRRQVERHRQARLPRREEVAEPLVGLGRGPEPGVLAHGPEAAPVHRRLDPAGVRILPGEPELGDVVEAPEIGRRRQAGHGRAPGRLAAGALGRALEGGPERLALPARERVLEPGRPGGLPPAGRGGPRGSLVGGARSVHSGRFPCFRGGF